MCKITSIRLLLHPMACSTEIDYIEILTPFSRDIDVHDNALLDIGRGREKSEAKMLFRAWLLCQAL